MSVKKNPYILPGISKDVLDKVPMGIYILNSVGDIEYFNLEMVRIAGAKKASDVVGLNIFKIPTYKKAGMLEILKKGLAGEAFKIEAKEYTSFTGNKTTIRSYHGLPIKDVTGKVVKLLLMVEDVTDKIRMEKELLREKNFSEKLLQSAPVFFVTISSKYKVLMMNNCFLKAVGYSLKEVVGKDYLETFIPPNEHVAVKKVFLSLIKNKRSTLSENTIISKDKKGFLVEWHGSPILNDHGKVDSFIGIGTDITQKRKNEESIKYSENKYRAIVEHTGSATVLFGEDKMISLCNSKFSEVTGYKKDEVEGKMKWTDFVANVDDLKRMQKYHEDRSRNKKTETKYEFHLKDKKDRIRIMMADIDLIPGTLTRVASMVDITELKDINQRLEKNEKQLRNILEHGTNVYYSHLPNNKITYISPQIKKLLGYSAEEVMTDWTKFLSDNVVNKEGLMSTKKAMMSGKAQPPYRLEFVHKNGQKKWVEVHEGPVVKNGEIIEMVGALNDITEIVASEKQLREKQITFEDFLNNVNSGVAIYKVMNQGVSGKDYIVQDFNKKALELENKKKKEVIGKSLSDLRPNIDQDGLIKIFEQVWQTGKPQVFPSKSYIDDNSSNWYENRVFKMPNGQIVAIYQDITKRKEAEEEVRKSEEKYRLLVENSNEAIVVAQDAKLVFSNAKVELLSGYSLQELDQMPFLKLIDPRDQAMVGKNYQDRLMGKKINETYDFRIVRKSGEVRWVQISAVKIDWHEKPATLNFLLDITEIKESREQIHHAKESAAQYLNLAGSMIVAIDTNGQVLLINKKGEEVLGYSKEEIVGKNWFDTVIPAHIKNTIKSFHQESLTGKKDLTKAVENEVLCKNGDVKLIKWQNSLIYDEDNNITSTLSSGEDITQEKKNQDELQEKVLELERMNELMIGRELKMIELKEKLEKLTGSKKYE